jgi:transcriptional regulator with XRE-family HTH domain
MKNILTPSGFHDKLQLSITPRNAGNEATEMIKDVLQEIMREQGLNPEKLAVRLQEAGYKQSYASVICWYYGYRNPSVSSTKALAAVLGVPVERLMAHVPAPSSEVA